MNVIQRVLPQAPLLPPMPPDSELPAGIPTKNENKENFEKLKFDEMPLFSPFFKCETNSDFSIKIDGIEYPAHKCIAASKLNKLVNKGNLDLHLYIVRIYAPGTGSSLL